MRRDGFEQRIKDFIDENSVQAEHHHFEDSCHSVQEAARAARADPLDFIKSIVMVSGDSRLIVAIVKGEDRASTKRVARTLDLDERPGTASPEEILDRTGYPCGGVPPFGFDAEFLVDPRVMEKEFIWSGGGSEHSLVRVSPQEMVRANHGRIVRVRK